MWNCYFKKVAKQLYWNHNSAWVFSCKFIAYFQNPFLKSTSGRLLLLLFTEAICVIFRKEFWDQTIRNTLRAEIFAVDWSKIFKFGGINFRDSAINSKFFGIKFCGWCLDRKTNQLEVKFTTNVKCLPLNCWFKYQK